ncbi:hypothetical protein HPB47_013723, partial [Ixodes persulcatus]
ERNAAIQDLLLKYGITPHTLMEEPPCQLLTSRPYRTVLDLLKPCRVRTHAKTAKKDEGTGTFTIKE